MASKDRRLMLVETSVEEVVRLHKSLEASGRGGLVESDNGLITKS